MEKHVSISRGLKSLAARFELPKMEAEQVCKFRSLALAPPSLPIAMPAPRSSAVSIGNPMMERLKAQQVDSFTPGAPPGARAQGLPAARSGSAGAACG